VRSATKVDGIPELRLDPFVGMVVDADRSPAARAQRSVYLVECRFTFCETCASRPRHPHQVRAHFEDVEHAAVVERLVVDANVVSFVEIHLDAHVAKRGIGLRGPRTPGLPVGDGRDAEYPLNVFDPLLLTSLELGPAVFPAGVLQIYRNCRLLAVRVRVIADVVPLQRGDHVRSAASLQYSSLLTDDLER